MPISKFRPTFTFTQDRLEQLKAIAPEAFADGKINWESLQQALGEFLEDENQDAEHFGLFWPGKREARRLATMPSKGTLVPALGEGINEDSTGNIFIEGENLEVLKLLQKSYAGRIKMIYIDPPYNIRDDRIYKDDYEEPLEEYLRKAGQADENDKLLTTNTQAGGRFHSNWLNMIYPRLRLARVFLHDEGVIFVSIDENEFSHLKLIMNEIFGEENFIASCVWEGALKNDSKFVSISHDYILCYAKNFDRVKENNKLWRIKKSGIEEIYDQTTTLREQHGSDYEAISEGLKNWFNDLPKNSPSWKHRHYNWVDEKGIYFAGDISAESGRKRDPYDVFHPVTGRACKRPARGWPKKETLHQWIQEKKVHWGVDENSVPKLKRYLEETEGQVLGSVIYKDRRGARQELSKLMGGDCFENPKDVDVLAMLIDAVTGFNDTILDFFSGSCTSSEAVFRLNREIGGNRRFIMVQLPESIPEDSPARKAGYDTIAEIGKERIRRVIAKMKKEANGISQAKREMPEDLGFKVFKLTRSNFKAWEDYEGENPEELEKLFDQAETPLIENWKEHDLLTEIILQQGFPLDSRITPQAEFKQNKIQIVESTFCAHRLFVCLDGKIKEDTIKRLELRSEDIFVCLDSALTDQAKMRLSDACNLKII